MIREKSDNQLDLHGGLDRGNISLIHLKELKSGSPRTVSARQRLNEMEERTLSLSELESRRPRWFTIAGKPLKTCGKLLDKAGPGVFNIYGGETITRETSTITESKDGYSTKSNSDSVVLRSPSVDISRASFNKKSCPAIGRAYLPPIVRAKYSGAFTVDESTQEHRNVVIAFLSLPSIFKQSSRAKGVDIVRLNDTYSALLGICHKHEGTMRDFLFEDKGCTMICVWGVVNSNEFDALRAVLFSLECIAAMSTLNEDIKIGKKDLLLEYM